MPQPTRDNRQTPDASSFVSFEYIWHDVRFAVRSLLKAPAFTVVAILVIAVGIGANTAVFSVINTVLLKPLTYPDPQSLVHLMNTGDQGSFPGANVPKFNIWRQQTGIFQQVAAYDNGGAGLNLTGNDQPEQVQGVHVTADYFSILGAPVIADGLSPPPKTAPMAAMWLCSVMVSGSAGLAEIAHSLAKTFS